MFIEDANDMSNPPWSLVFCWNFVCSLVSDQQNTGIKMNLESRKIFSGKKKCPSL
jgi:hypothetical protein